MNTINLEGYNEWELISIKKGDIISDKDIKYSLKSISGKGQFGIVFKCKTSIGRQVAIKIISKDIMVDDDDIYDNIQNEINIHFTLKNNKILNFEKMFQDNSNVYMVLELCELSLYNSIHDFKEFINENDAIKIIIDIIEGLMYLKENLIIHRDIKS